MTTARFFNHTRTAYINGAGQSVHILHAHSSFLSSLPRCYYKHDFSVNHTCICEQHMRIIIYLRSLISPLLFAVERPLPFINCFWSVLVLTDPDQLGVTGFAFWEFLTDTYGTQTAMVHARLRCTIFMFNIENNAGSERCLVMKYLDLHCCLCFIYRTHHGF